jgi:hypothetical protein
MKEVRQKHCENRQEECTIFSGWAFTQARYLKTRGNSVVVSEGIPALEFVCILLPGSNLAANVLIKL